MSITKAIPSEFDFLDRLRDTYSLRRVGDDCAVLPKNAETDLVVTADLLIEDIDFRLSWGTPEDLGRKALAVSLSDIAAMGAEPKWAMTSLGVPETSWKTDFLERFYKGWHELAAEYGVELVGGDISRSPDKVVIDSIVGGEVTAGRAVLRSGAKPGDFIYVTGVLGGAAAGLQLLSQSRNVNESRGTWQYELARKQLDPTPQVIIGKLLQTDALINSMIDVSDGLSSDLIHICDASGVGAQIWAEKLPVDSLLLNFTASDDERLDLALNGGEDFGLLFTSELGDLQNRPELSASRIGRITSEAGRIEIDRGGKITTLKPGGFRHF